MSWESISLIIENQFIPILSEKLFFCIERKTKIDQNFINIKGQNSNKNEQAFFHMTDLKLFFHSRKQQGLAHFIFPMT